MNLAIRAFAAVGGLLAGIGGVDLGALGSAAAQDKPAAALDAVEVRPNVFLLAGAGGNVVVQIGPAGVVLVDSGTSQASDAVLASVGRLGKGPIRYILNTSADADHTGGNDRLSRAGRTILGNPGSSGFSADVFTNGGAAGVLAHENVLARMSAPSSGLPFSVWPTKTYSGGGYPMYLNGEGIQVLHAPAAHSDGDSMVVFRRSDVIVAGDILDTERFPVIDVAKGGSIQGEIDALNRLVELTIPPFPLRWQEERTLVVPGHGFVCDYADVVDYRNVVTIVRDRVQDLIGKRLSLAQVKAADPTKGFRARYGSDTGPWRTDMFVEAVYTSLTATR